MLFRSKNLAYGNASGSYSVKNLSTALKRVEAAAVIMMSVPGPKMIWQFGELGYDYELNNDRLAQKPIRWDYFDEPDRRSVYDVFSKINKLKTSRDVFSTTNYNISLNGKVKYVELFSLTENVVAVANFDVVSQNFKLSLSKTGVWKDYFSDKSVDGNVIEESIEPGGYRLYISE